MMYRKFIATILAAAVAVTGLTAAPARADSDDLLKVLGGVAAIAIIGSAIKNARDDDHKVTRYNNHYYNNRGYKNGHYKHHKHHKHHKYHKHNHGYQGKHYKHRDVIRRDDYRARPLPKRVQRKLLPASCRVEARSSGRNFLAYSNWCLDRRYGHVNSLPRKCAVNARVLPYNKSNVVYSNRCLSRYGYTAARY